MSRIATGFNRRVRGFSILIWLISPQADSDRKELIRIVEEGKKWWDKPRPYRFEKLS
jgi:hypothetical protein